MPQETKSMPQNPADVDHDPGTIHQQLEGLVPSLATDDDLRAALEQAFDYRGDVTITLKSGAKLEGYIFDRRPAPTLAASIVRLLLSEKPEKVSISYADIAALAFTGRDTAAGKSWETWIKKYTEKKAAGEKNIGLTAEGWDQP